jgi:hypothetical protein
MVILVVGGHRGVMTPSSRQPKAEVPDSSARQMGIYGVVMRSQTPQVSPATKIALPT